VAEQLVRRRNGTCEQKEGRQLNVAWAVTGSGTTGSREGVFSQLRSDCWGIGLNPITLGTSKEVQSSGRL
jgi:hypothetical protein